MHPPLVTLSANTSWYLYNFRASTIRRLLTEGYEVACLSPEDDYSSRLPELGCRWWSLRMDNQGHDPARDLELIWQFWRYYRRLRPVVALHFTVKNNVYGTWAASAVGVPVINNVSGLGTAFIRTGIVAAIVRILYRSSQPLARRIFCQNEEDRQLLVENKLVPDDRLTLLPGSGVDLERFHPRLRTTHSGPFRFLYAGRMLADKGLYELVEAIRGLCAAGHDCVLWLCGFADVPNASAIDEAQLHEWGSEPFIEWLGPVDTMETVLSQVDCVVLPSYREGMPRSLLEAGAMALPVIATNVPGCRSIIEHEFNGLLCEAGDVVSLRSAMVAMLNTVRRERNAMGARGRQRVEERFCEEVVVEETLRAVKACAEVRVSST